MSWGMDGGSYWLVDGGCYWQDMQQADAGQDNLHYRYGDDRKTQDSLDHGEVLR
jgi:hypothetical protein